MCQCVLAFQSIGDGERLITILSFSLFCLLEFISSVVKCVPHGFTQNNIFFSLKNLPNGYIFD